MKQGKQRIKCFKYEENKRHREKGETILERVARESLYKEVTFRVRMGRSSPQKGWDWSWRADSRQKRRKGPDVGIQVLGLKRKQLGNKTKQNIRPKNYMLPTNKRIRLNNNCKG